MNGMDDHLCACNPFVTELFEANVAIEATDHELLSWVPGSQGSLSYRGE